MAWFGRVYKNRVCESEILVNPPLYSLLPCVPAECRRMLRGCWVKLVTHSPDGLNHRYLSAIWFNFAANLTDMDIHHAIGSYILVVPHFMQQFRSPPHATGFAGQTVQQVEF